MQVMCQAYVASVQQASASYFSDNAVEIDAPSVVWASGSFYCNERARHPTTTKVPIGYTFMVFK
jgi:hypothetical protein